MFIFIDFHVCAFAFAFKTQNAPCVLNAFYFHVRLTCKRVWCILHRTLSIQWLCPLHRTLSLKWISPAVSETLVLNETKPTKRSQIKICEKRQTRNVQFRFMPNAFRILKPIQKSSKCVWVFRNTGANAFAWPMKINVICTVSIQFIKRSCLKYAFH